MLSNTAAPFKVCGQDHHNLGPPSSSKFSQFISCTSDWFHHLIPSNHLKRSHKAQHTACAATTRPEQEFLRYLSWCGSRREQSSARPILNVKKHKDCVIAAGRPTRPAIKRGVLLQLGCGRGALGMRSVDALSQHTLTIPRNKDLHAWHAC